MPHLLSCSSHNGSGPWCQWLLVSRYPPDMDVLLVDTHLPDSDGISVVIPVPLFFKDKLYKKRFLFLRFIFMYYFDIDISLWAF